MEWTWLKTLFWCLIIYDNNCIQNTGIPRICKKTLCHFVSSTTSLGVVIQLNTSSKKVRAPEFKNLENSGQVT